MRIEGRTLGSFVNALARAYNPDRFDQMIAVYLNKARTSYTLDNDMVTRYFRVIEAANREGWTAQLVAASVEAAPGNEELRAFTQSLGLDPLAGQDGARLQRVISDRSNFHDAEPFLAALGRCISWTCRIVIPGGGGTGVLVAPDMVLTNHHVLKKLVSGEIAASDVGCVFDHKMLTNGTEISPGRRVGLNGNAVIASRPHSPEDERRNGGRPEAEALDYALVRLAEPVGDQPLGAKGPDDLRGSPRGYLQLSTAPAPISETDPMFVLQHPLPPGLAGQLPVQLAAGAVLPSPFPELRLRHNVRTLPGSSGSPCLNADLEMIALHHAGDPVSHWERPEWNQAIPVGKIVADMQERGVARFWNQ